MKQRTPHIVNWVLIALMVVLPLRGVIALERIACEMHDADAASVHDHSMHRMHAMNDQVQPLTTEKQTCCCCDVGTTCSNDCAAGLSVSLIMQSSVVLPERNRSVYRALIGNKPVFRDPSPPLRPPASVQI
ncbi:MAG: hypothetical protein KJP10_06655 [Gammaproteobacteria bacterium]|nr:hypothetical protein [Gammaproteobacteria bacterium]